MKMVSWENGNILIPLAKLCSHDCGRINNWVIINVVIFSLTYQRSNNFRSFWYGIRDISAFWGIWWLRLHMSTFIRRRLPMRAKGIRKNKGWTDTTKNCSGKRLMSDHFDHIGYLHGNKLDIQCIKLRKVWIYATICHRY